MYTGRPFSRLMNAVAFRPIPKPLGYVLAGAAVVVMAFVRSVLPGGQLPYLLFIPPIIGAALLFGRGPALFGTILAASIASYFFVSSSPGAEITVAQWASTGLFVAVQWLIVELCSEIRASFVAREREFAAITEARDALAANEAFMSSVLDSSNDCIKVLDLDAKLTFMSEGGKRVMEVSDFGAIQGCPWPDFWRDQGNIDARAAIEVARAGGIGRFQGGADTMAGNARWWDVVVTPILGRDGKPERLLSISRDISAVRRGEEQQALLSQELAHRLKNTMAITQAIVGQTLRQAGSVEQARDALNARLAALGNAHDTLVRSNWDDAEIGDIVTSALAAHNPGPQRMKVDGPRLNMSARCGLGLSLALHELATNAAKYGALSVSTGRVDVEWLVDTTTPDPYFRLVWRESGGPRVVEPTRRGFGSAMIERSLRGYFKGTAVIDYASTGVVFRLDAPLAELTTFSPAVATALKALDPNAASGV